MYNHNDSNDSGGSFLKWFIITQVCAFVIGYAFFPESYQKGFRNIRRSINILSGSIPVEDRLRSLHTQYNLAGIVSSDYSFDSGKNYFSVNRGDPHEDIEKMTPEEYNNYCITFNNIVNNPTSLE